MNGKNKKKMNKRIKYKKGINKRIKKKKGSKCGDVFVARTGNVDYSCKQLISTEIRKSKYHIIR